MKTFYNSLVVVVLLMMLTGCVRLLPSSKITVQSPWQDFDGARLAYEKIIPGVTTVDDMKKLGFDPFLLPNIRVMNCHRGYQPILAESFY